MNDVSFSCFSEGCFTEVVRQLDIWRLAFGPACGDCSRDVMCLLIVEFFRYMARVQRPEVTGSWSQSLSSSGTVPCCTFIPRVVSVIWASRCDVHDGVMYSNVH